MVVSYNAKEPGKEVFVMLDKEERAHDLAVALTESLHHTSEGMDMELLLHDFAHDYETAYKFFKEHLKDDK